MNLHSRCLDPLNGVRNILLQRNVELPVNFRLLGCFHTKPSAARKVGRAAAHSANMTVGACSSPRCVGVRSPERRDWQQECDAESDEWKS